MYAMQPGGFVGNGVKCGTNVRMKAGAGIFIGDNSTIHSGAKLMSAFRTGSGYNLAFAPIFIGKNTNIGSNAILMPGAILRDGESIPKGSLVEAPQHYAAYKDALEPRPHNLLETNVPILFVLGTGRSGTTSLSQSFQQLDNVQNGHETFGALIPWSVKFANGDMSGEELRIKLKLLCSQYAFPPQTNLIVEADHRLWNMIPLLEEIFAHNPPQYLFINRSKESFVRSALERKWYTLQPAENYTTYPHHYFRPTAHGMGEMTPQSWKKLSAEGKLAWYWDKINSTILQQLGQLPEERTICCNLEQLSAAAGNIRQRLSLPEGWQIPIANAGKKQFAASKIGEGAMKEMAQFNQFEKMMDNSRYAQRFLR